MTRKHLSKQQEYDKLYKRFEKSVVYYSDVDIDTDQEAKEYEPKINEIIKRLGELSRELEGR